jgi:hypothetical protein
MYPCFRRLEWCVSEDFYHDDPVEEISRTKVRSKLLTTAVVVVGSIFFFQSTLAGNISLNSNQGIEFGQSVSQAVACSGATNLLLTPLSTFVNGSPGSHYLQSVTVSNIPISCYGDDFIINSYDDSSSTPLALFNSTSTNAVVYNNKGTFQKGIGSSGMTVSSGVGSFTITFTNPVAQSSSVFKLTIRSTADQTVWTSRTSARDDEWDGVAYGNGIFVAVGAGVGTTGVMTSPEGITWTSRVAAVANATWYGVTFANGIFVAVGFKSSVPNAVMTSSDGINWTARNSVASQSDAWNDVTFGNGIFVAVADDRTYRVMTSSDGITWTGRTAAGGVGYSVGTRVPGGDRRGWGSTAGNGRSSGSSRRRVWLQQPAPTTGGARTRGVGRRGRGVRGGRCRAPWPVGMADVRGHSLHQI